MHRAQIILEEWQYQALKSHSEREGESVSHLVRKILTAHLAPPVRRRQDPLSAIAGIAEDASSYGRSHNQVVYSKK